MEELLRLRALIENQKYTDALDLINEMEEMSLEDKLHKIRSYSIILLLHLIKRHAEKRTTRSWDLTIKNAISEIKYVNTRRKSKGQYAQPHELEDLLRDSFEMALGRASIEAFEGLYTEEELLQKVHQEKIIQEALENILN